MTARTLHSPRPDSPPPAGYKRTEVGVIPEDWEVCFLEEIAGVDADVLPANTPPDYQFRYIAIEDAERGTLKGFSDQVFRTAPSRARKRIRPGEIMFGTVRPNLESHLIFNEPGDDWVCSTGFAVLSPRQNLCISGFLGQVVFSGIMRQQVEMLLTGSNYPAISVSDVRRIRVPLPSLPEQRAIAEALSDVDAWLAALDKLIAKKRAVKQAAMQALLTGRVRLPGFEGRWEAKPLGHALSLQYGKSQRGISADGGSYPILATSGEVGRTDRYLYDKPSVIIGRKGTIDAPQYVDVPFWAIDTTYYTVISEDYSAKFLYYLLSTLKWESYNEASGVPSLNAHTVQGIEVSFPRFPEQHAIAEVLSDMDAEIEALERQRAKAQAIKQGMMQELLTGRIRLVGSETA